MRAQISILRKEGLSLRAIGNRLNVTHSCVSKTLHRLRSLPNYASRPRCGRPKVTSERDDNMIHRIVKVNPRASSSFVASALSTVTSASTRTIRRRLLEKYHLRAYRPARKPLLSAKNIRDRLLFCRRYAHWTVNDWERVLFSDETLISQFQTYAPYVRRPCNQRHNNRYTTTTVRNCPKVMTWACISSSGPGSLSLVPKGESVKSALYCHILEEHLQQSMAIGNCQYFQHDGAPAHTSRMTKEWLMEHDVTLLQPWPGSSPDLNPIENCWVVLKRHIAALRPTSEHDLRLKIQNEFLWITVKL